MGTRITLRGIRLGRELRLLREAAGVSADEAGAAIDKSDATISRFETGRTVIRRPELLALLDLYGVADPQRRAYFVAFAAEARQVKNWWAPYGDVIPAKFDTWLSLEPEASEIDDYASLNVPGVFQTEEFARAQMAAGASPHETDRLVALRLHRQQIFSNTTGPVYRAVLDEAVLHRLIGGAEVMASQLRHLATMAGHPRVELRVVPFAAGSYRMYGLPFSIMSFADLEMPSIIFLETVHGNIYLERESDVRQYTDTFANQQAAALPPEESLRLIERLAARF